MPDALRRGRIPAIARLTLRWRPGIRQSISWLLYNVRCTRLAIEGLLASLAL